jgi:hypothetical protein
VETIGTGRWESSSTESGDGAGFVFVKDISPYCFSLALAPNFLNIGVNYIGS